MSHDVSIEASEVDEEVSRAMTWLGRLGTFFKVLGAVGLVISVVAGVIELVQGAEQYVVHLPSFTAVARGGLNSLRLTLRTHLQEEEAGRGDPRPAADAAHDGVLQAGGDQHHAAA